MSEPQPISATNALRYQIDRGQKMNTLPKSRPAGKLLKRAPVVIPSETPRQTMCRIFKTPVENLEGHPDYVSMREYLATYQRAGDAKRWDDFRNKIPVGLLDRFGTVLVECRRNGFILPAAEGDVITWRQVVSTHGEPGDLCTMCERPCRRREMIETGELKKIKTFNKQHKEKPPCWAEGGRA